MTTIEARLFEMDAKNISRLQVDVARLEKIVELQQGALTLQEEVIENIIAVLFEEEEEYDHPDDCFCDECIPPAKTP